MKSFVIILLIIPILGISQQLEGYWKRQAAACITAMSSGFFHRRAEIRKDDFRRYAAVHPNADPQFANPRLSFRNKYKDWPTDQSAAFPLSKSLLVGVTDGFHMDNTISIISMSASVGFSMSLYEKPNFKQILIQCLVTWASYGAGRWAADKVYKKID